MNATTILVEAGMDNAIALERGEDGVITIEGTDLSQGLNDLAPFQRVMQQLPQMLCHDLLKQKTRAKKTGQTTAVSLRCCT